MSTTYKYVEHKFGPNETIKAIIRRYNHLELTPIIQDKLLAEFNNVNGKHVPKVGQTVKIPILAGFIGAHPDQK